MSINIYNGLPGSGKSLKLASIAMDKLYRNRRYFNKSGKKRLVLTNLKLQPHVEAEFQGFIKYWTDPATLVKERDVDIIWDEVATYLDSTQWANVPLELKRFLQLHRHYGIDIFLITQDIKKVTPDITCLSETHYRAASGAANPIPGFLIYQQMVGGEAVSRKFIRKKKEVFDLYKSTNDHSSSTLNIGKIYLIVALIAALGAAYALKKWFASFSPQPVESASVIQSPVKPLEKTTPQNVTRSKPVQTLLGGTPYPVSVIKDHTGEHIIFAGNFYRKDLFPFKLAKTRTGLVALLPPDALSFALKYEENLEGKIKATSSGSGTEPPAVPVANGSERKARESEGVTAGL